MAADADPQSLLDLVDWRRRVGDLWRLASQDGPTAFRAGRDDLFRDHPQSPIPGADRATFAGLDYYPYDPAFKVTGRLVPPESDEEVHIDTGGADGVITYRRAGSVDFDLFEHGWSLTVFSLVGYGGGLFLPFRDATSGQGTYGGGRYLFDSVKNTDGPCLEIAVGSTEVSLDFNYAYNPSCAYNPHWACPLAPPENRLACAIAAGEKDYHARA